jgi:hypothetical protein
MQRKVIVMLRGFPKFTVIKFASSMHNSCILGQACNR